MPGDEGVDARGKIALSEASWTASASQRRRGLCSWRRCGHPDHAPGWRRLMGDWWGRTREIHKRLTDIQWPRRGVAAGRTAWPERHRSMEPRPGQWTEVAVSFCGHSAAWILLLTVVSELNGNWLWTLVCVVLIGNDETRDRCCLLVGSGSAPGARLPGDRLASMILRETMPGRRWIAPAASLIGLLRGRHVFRRALWLNLGCATRTIRQ